MRLLFLDESIPYPPNSGKKIRTYNLVKRLAEDNEIYYLSFLGEDHDSELAAKHLQSINIQTELVNSKIQGKSGPIFYLKLLANIFRVILIS